MKNKKKKKMNRNLKFFVANNKNQKLKLLEIINFILIVLKIQIINNKKIKTMKVIFKDQKQKYQNYKWL